MGGIVPGIILAGGRSSRMGRAKALLPVDRTGETFVARIARTLRSGGVDDVVVVAAAEEAGIADALRDEVPPPRIVVNPEPDRGQLSSLLVGLRAVDRPGIGGMLVTLVDVPLVSPDTVRALLDTYRRTHAPVVRPVRRGRHGHPVIFDRALFGALRDPGLRMGANAVVRAYEKAAIDVAVDDEGAFVDIDTPEDYLRVFKQPMPDG